MARPRRERLLSKPVSVTQYRRLTEVVELIAVGLIYDWGSEVFRSGEETGPTLVRVDDIRTQLSDNIADATHRTR